MTAPCRCLLPVQQGSTGRPARQGPRIWGARLEEHSGYGHPSSRPGREPGVMTWVHAGHGHRPPAGRGGIAVNGSRVGLENPANRRTSLTRALSPGTPETASSRCARLGGMPAGGAATGGRVLAIGQGVVPVVHSGGPVAAPWRLPGSVAILRDHTDRRLRCLRSPPPDHRAGVRFGAGLPRPPPRDPGRPGDGRGRLRVFLAAHDAGLLFAARALDGARRGHRGKRVRRVEGQLPSSTRRPRPWTVEPRTTRSACPG
jgi:hypothetical protein